MAHPIMFDPDDVLLAKVRELALVLPGAAEKVSHGRPTFFTTKVFAYYGGSRRIEGEWVQHPHSVLVHPDDDERAALLEDPRVYLPAYLAPSGWVGLNLTGPPSTGGDDLASPSREAIELVDWAELAELLDSSFRRTATRRLVSQLAAERA